jgi:hypothetical protein
MCENGGNRQKLCNYESCKVCYNRSFASSPHVNEWDYEKNGEIRPRDVFKNSGKYFYFMCGNCKHSYDKSLVNANKGRDCPYCCSPCKKLCENMNCKMCHRNSFASHPKSKYWHIMNDLSPREVIRNSNRAYLFICDTCFHEFETSLDKIISRNAWCSFCASKKLCDKTNCRSCFDNSFAAHPKAKFWDYTRNIQTTPRYVFKGSDNKFWFICENKHGFLSALSHITNLKNNTWCPYCKESKGEKQISEYLIDKNIEYTTQKTFHNLINVNQLKYDLYFIFNDIKHVIEFDGKQHFEFIEYFHKEEINFLERQEIDLIKTQYCLNNSMRLLRISYDCMDNIPNIIDNFLQSDMQFMTSNDELYEHHLKLSSSV